ncbi:tyrosyl-tRNA synthetase [Breznakia sp. PF5-3]|uniref:tyrosine--tRNA ligase n=1 Tax=unclassified Breznakia TaxID=2623764 RepID=UPI0024066251|nr:MULTISPECIES: tyrosine--tRNA ligase [unclassified Breznakia]MDF9823888.1 tyrosyl-tRNA synthetase [Breznakia sp. PM6-1]MDF9834687.1 tyrosyl-tRNA synthetase [Breznakia sp. PF5-3]MDF9836878.1 tyrosyl-tRNA synthetase [Breznakia sp. PFB2-8]MDF9858895.1 tyrosyl-tRNA synthetase [Breznakia sp. PH5-24]
MKLFDELKWRGLINDISSPELEDKLNNGSLTFYIGTDPTGDTLHIGHYSSFLIAKRLKDAGHHPILLVGGGTGLIGDPKPNTERPMITKEQLDYNYKKLRSQVEKLFGFEVVNNYDWMKDIHFIDYLRDYGKYFNINYMLAKETVKSRLDIGITYTEFSYMILQALDFLHLYEYHDCVLQVGGQDQWGNITAGIELIRKKLGKEAYGFTMPLITKADGTKFGKSEGNAIWLDKEQTSAYEMYQFLVNSEDEKVIDYLKKLTFLDKPIIDELEEKVKVEPFKREAQKVLGKEVVTFLHGEKEYEKALNITNALFKGNILSLSQAEIHDALKGFDKIQIADNVTLVDCLVNANIASSKREAREWISGNSIQVNGEKITDLDFVVSSKNAIDKNCTLIKRGKRNYFVIEQGV